MLMTTTLDELDLTLRIQVDEDIEFVYFHAVDKAADETGLDRRAFSSTSPYLVEQVLDPTVFPGEF